MKFDARVLNSQSLVSGPLPLREDLVALKNGTQMKYSVVEYPDAVAVVPILADGSVILVRVPRYPFLRYLWELPGGRVDKGEKPVTAAARELTEETGYEAGTLTHLFTYLPEPSHSTEKLYLFRAEALKKTRKPSPEREGLLTVRVLREEAVHKLVKRRLILSSWTLLGLILSGIIRPESL